MNDWKYLLLWIPLILILLIAAAPFAFAGYEFFCDLMGAGLSWVGAVGASVPLAGLVLYMLWSDERVESIGPEGKLLPIPARKETKCTKGILSIAETPDGGELSVEKE